MSLYGALFSGVSGLKAQSSAMGAIADNVTNVNTVGYKRTEIQFRTLVTKQVSLTSYAPGGVQSKPRSGIDVQGLLLASTASTDLAISGDGLFIVNEAASPASGDIFAYTRAGSFKVDKEGHLQNASGWYMQGWPLKTWDNSTQASTVTVGQDTFMKAYTNDAGDTAYINDNIVDSTNLKPLNLNTIGGTATATTTIAMGLNLPAGDSVGGNHKTDVQFFDSLGNPHNISHTWVKRASNAWDVYAIPPTGSTSFVIEDQTTLRNNYYAAGRLDFTSTPDSGTDMTMTVDDTDYTINFTTSDDSPVKTQALTVSAVPAATETFDVLIDGSRKRFEFIGSGDTVSTAGNIGVVIGSDTTITASNLSAAIEAQMDSVAGTATWATSSGNTITFKNTNANAVTFTDNTSGDISIAAASTVTVSGVPTEGETVTLTVGGKTMVFEWDNSGDGASGSNIAVDISGAATNDARATALQAAIESTFDTQLFDASALGGAHSTVSGSVVSLITSTDIAADLTNVAITGGVNTALDINVSSRSLSQVMDELASRLQNIFHYENGGVPSSPPSAWTERLAGENAVYFTQGSSANAITVDARNTTTSGVHATIQGGLTNSAGTNIAYSVEALGGTVAWTGAGNYAVEFNGDGTPAKFVGSDETSSSNPRLQYKIGFANGASDMDGSNTPAISVNYGNYNTTEGLTQFSGSYQINYISQNGASFGNFAGVSVGQDGIVTALFDNGVTKPAFMIPIATLVNPNGLESRTGNVWVETDGSGSPTVRAAGSGGAGLIASAALEASTVDIGEEFTNMIPVHRAYSGASKVISTADEMLEELSRLKR